MTTPDPITTAREALDDLPFPDFEADKEMREYWQKIEAIRDAIDCAEKLKAENERLTNKVQSQHDYMAPRYDAAMAEIEKLKAERDEQWHLMNRWAYNAGRARDDVRTLLRIDDEMEYGKNSQKNLDALEEIRSRYAQGGDEYRRPDLLDELRRLTSQLEQAERVIAPFAAASAIIRSYNDADVMPAGPIKVANIRAASQWIKDRQAKGEAS